MKRLMTAALQIFILTICSTAAILAAPGDLDSTFGTGGKVIAELPFNQDSFTKQVEVQPDGKIIVFTSGFNGYLLRFNSDGTLDASFGNNGFVNNSGFIPVSGNGFAVSPDGRIYGFSRCGQGGYAACIFRLNSGGTSGELWRLYEIVPNFSFYNPPFLGQSNGAILVQPDGKIVVFGTLRVNQGEITQIKTVVARLNTDGTLDPSFGTNGVTPLGDATGLIAQVKRQPDGKILFLEGTRIGRINADGTLDTSFGSYLSSTLASGFFSIETKSVSGNTFDLQSDGKILVVTRTNDARNFIVTSKITRFHPNGRDVDISFGNYGSVVYPPQPEAQFELTSVLVQPNGKIVVGGTKVSGSARNFAVQRLRRDGTLDRTFGADGTTTTAFRGVNDFLTALAFQPDGNLIAVGDIAVSFSAPYDVGAARFLVNSRAQPAQFDFDGDDKSDFSIFRSENRMWQYLQSSNNRISELPWGLPTDKPVPADFNGDGKTDFAVFREGVWYIYGGSPFGYVSIRLGQAGDVPVPADYDGDRRADAAVFRAGVWHIRQSSNNQVRVEQFGLPSDKPVLGDFDGDGKNDLAVYRNGAWFVQDSRAGFFAYQFGVASDRPVAADYDADGKTDFAVFRAGVWYLQQSSTGFAAMQFGLPTDEPAPADYDGDGRADIAVFREGNWYVHQSANNSFRAAQLGVFSDTPIPSVFLP